MMIIATTRYRGRSYQVFCFKTVDLWFSLYISEDQYHFSYLSNYISNTKYEMDLDMEEFIYYEPLEWRPATLLPEDGMAL